MSINSIAFSPDGQLLAIVSEDGTLTILDYMHERVLDVYRSYYGAMLCVTWSPDGQYVLTGGQDDLVSIWSIADQALVARCVGHQSWVTDVKFDPWRCDERNYRFGSVGEDCRLLLWDFSVGMLGRPKAMRQRGSVSSHHADRRASISTASRIGSATNLAAVDRTGAAEIIHEVNSKASTANLPPVMSKRIGEEPMSWLGFEEHCILTACKDGMYCFRVLSTIEMADHKC
jgi:WD40 repeat protein